MNNLCKKTATELISLIRQDKISSLDIVSDLLDRIDKEDKKINAYVYLDKDKVLKEAKEKEKFSKDKKLLGIPVAIKDNICIKDEPTTCCSKMLQGFSPPYNATVIDKLIENGALCFGKTNMDEFAFGSSCETSFYGVTRNPWDLDRIPGGSSGGAAAAVANDQAIVALGSDTGGSIRQPCSLCGVVGLKPTYGRVSRYGLIAFASSLDQIGTITKSVEDNALLLNIIAGYDEKDSTSVNIEVPDYNTYLDKNIKDITIGIPKEYFTEGLDSEVRKIIEDSKKILSGLGAKFKEISLPHTEYGISVYYIIGTAEASSNLARFDGIRYGYRISEDEVCNLSADIKSKGEAISLDDVYKYSRSFSFGEETKRRILLGTYALSSGYYEAYYLKAQKVRTLIKRDFDIAFKECDCILTPTTPEAAFKIGEKKADPLSMYLSDIYTISANLSGIPAITVPCGLTESRLPVGLQLMAKAFDEKTLFRIAYTFQEKVQFNKLKPESII